MSPLRSVQRGWRRLREAWTKNDGKPKEEWAPGLDLKEAVLIAALTGVTAIMLCMVAYSLIGQD